MAFAQLQAARILTVPKKHANQCMKAERSTKVKWLSYSEVSIFTSMVYKTVKIIEKTHCALMTNYYERNLALMNFSSMHETDVFSP